MKIFGVSLMTIVIILVALWAGYKWGASIPVINSL
jgi:ABC-type transport system involved in cytochrome c biogenesis permease subunit